MIPVSSASPGNLKYPSMEIKNGSRNKVVRFLSKLLKFASDNRAPVGIELKDSTPLKKNVI